MSKKEILKQFKEAKETAFRLGKNTYRRPYGKCEFLGANIEGKFYVLGKKIKNPEILVETASGTIGGREVVKEYKILSLKKSNLK